MHSVNYYARSPPDVQDSRIEELNVVSKVLENLDKPDKLFAVSKVLEILDKPDKTKRSTVSTSFRVAVIKSV